jgi:hypothetical protein
MGTTELARLPGADPERSIDGRVNNTGGPRDGRAAAAIGYELSLDGKRLKFSLPVMLTQEFYTAGSASNAWIKATG